MITFDFETKSFADLTKVGAWAYSEDPTTDVICACWSIDGGPIQAWTPETTFQDFTVEEKLFEALDKGTEVEAHNCAFEISIWENVMVRRYGWPEIPLRQWRDLMAVACYYAMPAKLDRLLAALKLPGKDPRGGRLISKYSKLHLKTAHQGPIPAAIVQEFVEYCAVDVDREFRASNLLGDLPAPELENFLADLEMNYRGIYLDQDGIDAATAIVDQRSAELTLEFNKLTGLNPTQGTKLLGWFERHGLKLDNMQADYLEELIEDGEVPQGEARRALEIRLAISKASTKKLDAMSRARGTDGRARFQTRYHGAVTGRNTGSGFQPLNLNRGFDEAPEPEALVRDIMYRDPAWLDCAYGDAMDAVAKASRHWIMAQDDTRIMSGDFVSIEAVILACLAGEEWKIEAFRNKEKIYERMADKIYGYAPKTVTKETHPLERQDGKTGELAFGYQGALGAWLKFDSSGRHSDARIIEFCRGWRSEHPATVSLWKSLDHAAIDAVRTPGFRSVYRQIGFEIVDEWLTMILPNGKRLWYREPELRAVMPRWHEPETKLDCAEGSCNCKEVLQLTYLAQKAGQWKRVSTYGGRLCENACQSVSREVLVSARKRVEAGGYPIILTVYDELVCEVPKSFGSREELASLMRGPLEDWCKDWPINVDVWEGARYKK